MAMIAILLASYNGERYIGEQLDSLLAQSCQDFVCYIHDDGSTDHTVGILQKYTAVYPDKFVLLEGHSCGGAARNFMYLLSRVEADYYFFCDQDDVWKEDKVEVLYQCCKEAENGNPAVPSLVFSDLCVVDENLRTIAPSFMKYNKLNPYDLRLEKLIVQNVAPGCVCAFNRALREESLKLEDVGAIYLHDWWVVIAVAATGKIAYIDKPLVYYRQHSGNEIGALQDTGVKRLFQLFVQFATFAHIEETRAANQRRVQRAGQLRYLEIKNIRYKEMIDEISRFYRYSKIKRIAVFLKYGVHRNKRDLWMYLWL